MISTSSNVEQNNWKHKRSPWREAERLAGLEWREILLYFSITDTAQEKINRQIRLSKTTKPVVNSVICILTLECCLLTRVTQIWRYPESVMDSSRVSACSKTQCLWNHQAGWYYSYSGGAPFDFLPGHRLAWLKFYLVFFSPFELNAGIVPRLRYDRFFQIRYGLLFINHHTTRLYTRAWQNSGSRAAWTLFKALVRLAQKYISESFIYKWINILKSTAYYMYHLL